MDYPRQVEIEVTSRCNLRCEICVTTSPKWNAQDIDLDMYRRVADRLFPHAQIAVLQGGGEPLFARHWDEMFAIAASHNIDIGFYTNGTCFTKKRIDDMIAYAKRSGKFVDIHVSLDGATEETCAKVRGKGVFPQAIETLEAISQRRGDADVRFGTNIVLMTHNIRELPDLVRMTHELGGYVVYGTHLIVFREEMDRYHLRHQPELGDEMIREARALADELGIVVNLPEYFAPLPEDTRAETSNAEGDMVCEAPFDRINIASNGDIKPCCAIASPFENVRDSEKDVLELWRTGKFEETREMFRRGLVPECCRNCGIARIRNQDLSSAGGEEKAENLVSVE